MLGDGRQTPTRSELLNMVRKHSEMLGKSIVDEENDSDVDMDSRFWHDVMDLYFFCGRESREDDLVFFVKRIRHGSDEDMDDNSPYFVRRWAPKLDDLIGGNSADVDWRRSFFLNFIAQTSFSVTVAICSQQVLTNYQNGEGKPLSPIYKVLTDADHCYCVLLNALDGAAFPSESVPKDCNPGDTSSSTSTTSTAKVQSSKITLFSGFAGYQMVRDAYDAGRSGFGSLLSLHSSGKADRIYMRGPGGRGEVEVAVSGVADQSKSRDSSHLSPDEKSKKGLSFGAAVRRAASVASVAAKHAYAAASAVHNHEQGMIPLKCCLMSISLPWEHISHDLLFKGSSPVNL